ncbi:uncharacterized protein LOC133197050 [Saccostrea echinata]|uniref:uncharacterized protein LOC133197050 n=1 Tax=Saccostrea echinata TaxID=191078 RepID=UPI002A80D9EA|nr:uncharacterized protein LOC133197050 [Saccostrea echinata]
MVERKSDCFLPDLENIFIVVGFCCILIIINVLCVYCCVSCQVKRKLRSLRIQQENDSPCKPISEAITRIYKSINVFEEEQSETYDLAASVIKKSNFAITSRINDKDNYDNGFFRLLTQSGDYDMAWSNALSSPTSPDVEYDHVQNVGAALIARLPEEEIFSKQSPLIQDISSEVNKMCNNGSDNVNECVSEKSTDSINGLSHVDERNLKYQTVANFQESDLNNIVGNDAHDNGTQQKQNIKYEKNGAINQIHEKLSTTDETVVENGKTRKDKKAGKSLEMQNGKRDVNVKKSKVHRESKTGKASNNLPECPLINEDTMKSSSQRSGKMVDKATSLLVANMNKVLSETKL